MGTYYKIASEAKLRKDVTQEEVEKAIAEADLPISDDDQFFVERRSDNVLYMVLGVDNYMGIGTPTDFDNTLIKLVSKYADFDNAVEVNSSGDNMDGFEVWYIGPKKKIIAAKIAAIDKKIADLNAERIKIADETTSATDEIINTLNFEPT